MYYCLYVFSNADTKASFLCLSGYTIIDKASFAANGNNIAFFWLISIGGDQFAVYKHKTAFNKSCLLYTSPSPRDGLLSRMPSSA